MKDHLQRKIVCKPCKSDVEVAVLLEELYPTNNPNLVCTQCKTVFIKPGMLLNHNCSEKQSCEPVVKQLVKQQSNVEEHDLKTLVMKMQAEIQDLKSQLRHLQEKENIKKPYAKENKVMQKHQPDNGIKPVQQLEKGHRVNPIYSPDTSSENITELMVKINKVRSTADISDLIVGRCEEIYFQIPKNRGFKIVGNGTIMCYERNDNTWKESTITCVSKDMMECLTEDILHKIEEYPISLNNESKIAWDNVEGIYNDRTSRFSKTTSDKIATTLLIPEIEKTISI